MNKIEQHPPGEVAAAADKGFLFLGSDGSTYRIIKVNSDGSINANLLTGDIEIGAVELKNASDDTRATVSTKGSTTIVHAGVFNSSGIQVDAFGGIDPVAIKDGTTPTQKLAVDATGKIGINSLPAITGSVTVTATALDIRTLTSADVVTVTGGAGQTADVKITLDGESVPVTGTFWQATQPISAASLPLPTGAASSANQSTEITSLQLLDDVPSATNAALSKFNPIGGQLDDTTTTAATEDNVAPIRITAQRAAHANLRNNTGTEIGTASAPVRTDPTGSTTQPVSVSTLPVRSATVDSITAKLATDAIQNGLAALTPKFAFANISASTTDGSIVAAVASKKIRVLAITAITGATATNITFNTKPAGAGTAKTSLKAMAANGGFVYGFNPLGWFETNSGDGLTATTGAGSTTGVDVVYAEV